MHSVLIVRCVFWQRWNVDPWWRHQMETFSALLAICAGNSAVTSEFPTQRLVTRSFDVLFDLRLNKWLSGGGWWFETPSCPLWRHCNGLQDEPQVWYQSSGQVSWRQYHAPGWPWKALCLHRHSWSFPLHHWLLQRHPSYNLFHLHWW